MFARLGLILAVFMLACSDDSGHDERSAEPRPIAVESGGYVSSDACRACHPREYGSWHDSFHRTMTQVASPDSVQADFDGVRLALWGREYRLSREGDEFWVEAVESGSPSGGPERLFRRRIQVATGSHHFQTYWHWRGPGRRMQDLPFYWLIREQRWVPREAVFLHAPDGAFTSSDYYPADWNRNCIRCHATHGRPGIGDPSAPVDTRVAEFGIACESCHGPANDHVAWNTDPKRRYQLHLGGGEDQTIVQPKRLDHRRASQVCGQCHGINEAFNAADMEHWLENGHRYRPGDDLSESLLLVGWSTLEEQDRERLRTSSPGYLEGRFWSDGMVRVSGREFNGLADSPCFQRGELSCLSCHRMHQSEEDPRTGREWANDQLGIGMEGNGACVQCHERFEAEEQLVAHTRHEPESSGSLCYNCHMPYTSFGLLTAIRSHTVDSPTVTASLETGRPNACNQCHLDRSLGWAAEELENGWEVPAPEMSDLDRLAPASVQWLLSGDAGQRALAAWTLGWPEALEASGSDWTSAYLALALNDRYDAVRYVASRSLRRASPFANFQYDYMAPPPARAAKTREALRIAEEAGGGRRRFEDPDGRLPRNLVGHLLANRDESPLDLVE